MRVLPIVVPLILTLSACGGPPGGDRPEPGQRPGGDGAASLPLLASPNGEPLGRAVCADALTVWLGRADANHDGLVDRAEFLADAQALFVRMDRDQDGFVTPDELQALRMPFVTRPDGDEPARRPGPGGGPAGGGAGPGGGGRGPGGGGPGGMGGMGAPTGGGNRAPGGGDRPIDPVMTADSNLDFKVSAAEFAARAGEEFARLDGNADQRLGLDEVTKACPSQPDARSRR